MDENSSRVRRVVSAALDAVAVLAVLAALVLPDPPDRLSPLTFARIPVEGLAAVALVLALPVRRETAARRLAGLGGVLLGVLTLGTLFDVGFYDVLVRPFDPVLDWGLLGDAAGRPRSIRRPARSRGGRGSRRRRRRGPRRRARPCGVALGAPRPPAPRPGVARCHGPRRGMGRLRCRRRPAGARRAPRVQACGAGRGGPRAAGRRGRPRPGGVRARGRRRRLRGLSRDGTPRRPAWQGRSHRLRRELRPERPGGSAAGARRRSGPGRRQPSAGRRRLQRAQRLPDLSDGGRRKRPGPLDAALGSLDRQPAAVPQPRSRAAGSP